MNNRFTVVITIDKLLQFMKKYNYVCSHLGEFNLNKQIKLVKNQFIASLRDELSLDHQLCINIYYDFLDCYRQITKSKYSRDDFWFDLKKFAENKIIYPDE